MNNGGIWRAQLPAVYVNPYAPYQYTVPAGAVPPLVGSPLGAPPPTFSPRLNPTAQAFNGQLTNMTPAQAGSEEIMNPPRRVSKGIVIKDPTTGKVLLNHPPEIEPEDGELSHTSPEFTPRTSPEFTPRVTSPEKSGPSYAERKAMAEKISTLEKGMENIKERYEKEVTHYKTQLCEQMDEFTKLRTKAKRLKQDYKIVSEQLTDQTRLEDEHEKLKKQIDDERKQWLTERENKSVGAKKIMAKLNVELEQRNREKDEAKSQIIQKTRENEELVQKVEDLEQAVRLNQDDGMNSRKEMIEYSQKYKLAVQQIVQERLNLAQMRLRIAYANCQAQIRERSALQGDYKLEEWRNCQDRIRDTIDTNNAKYQEYINMMHTSTVPQDILQFEQEPPCPASEEQDVLPLQRYEDIFLGREAPPLPKQWPPAKENNMFTDAFLANLMNQSANMSKPTVASTPAPPPSAPYAQAPHFSFTDAPPEASTSFSRPPTFGLPNNLPPTTLPQTPPTVPSSQTPPMPRSVTPLEPSLPRPLSNHSSAAPSPRASVVSPSSIQPTFDIGEVPVTNRGRGGRGRGNRNRTAASSQPAGPPAVGTPPAQDAAPPQSKSQILKSNIKRNHPHLSDAEISRYLVRVRQENQNLTKATPALILDRVNEMVEADNIRTGRVPRRSSSSNDNRTECCPICYDGYDSGVTSRLGCGHLFHKECISKWFLQNHTCPTCRSHQPPPSDFPPLGR